MSISERNLSIYRSRKRALLDKVRPAVNELWNLIDAHDLEPADALMMYLPLIADRYGKAMAVMAADYFDESRIAAKALGSYAATTATGALWKIERDVAYAFGDGFEYSSERDFLTSTVSAVVEDYGRQTIVENSARDPRCGGYVSIPGAKPCVFCMMKSLDSYSNYMGEKLETEIDGDAWHDNCTCTLQPLWDDAPEFVEERIDEYRAAYEDGRAAAYDALNRDPMGALTLNEVMMGMRLATGIQH